MNIKQKQLKKHKTRSFVPSLEVDMFLDRKTAQTGRTVTSLINEMILESMKENMKLKKDNFWIELANTFDQETGDEFMKVLEEGRKTSISKPDSYYENMFNDYDLPN